MKAILIIGSIVFLLSCNNGEKEPVVEHTVKDTSMHLKMPKQVNFDTATEEDLRRAIDIRGDKFVIRLNGSEEKLKDISYLQEYCMNHKRELNAKRFSLVTDSATTYRILVDVLDIFTIEKVINFKIVRKVSGER